MNPPFENARALVRDQLTTRGRRALILLGVIGLLGIDTRRNQTFMLFAAVFAAFMVSTVIAVFDRVRARFELTLPRRITAGRSIVLRGKLIPDRDASGEVLIGFPSKRRSRALTIEPLQVAVALENRDVFFEVKITRRGRYELRTPTVRSLDPFGMIGSSAKPAVAHTVLCHPAFFPMDHLQLDAGRKLQPGGIPLLSSTGDAVEFVGTRDYRPGDPLRRIHFRSWARRGTPVVKEYQEEYVSRVALVVDTWAGPDKASFERSLSLVASIADHFGRTEQVLDVLAAGKEIFHLSTGRGLGSLEEVLDVLACLETTDGEPFAQLAPALFEELAQITTVVAVMLDWDPIRAGFLRSIRDRGTEVRAFVVKRGEVTLAIDGELSALRIDPGEIDEALKGAP